MGERGRYQPILAPSEKVHLDIHAAIDEQLALNPDNKTPDQDEQPGTSPEANSWTFGDAATSVGSGFTDESPSFLARSAMGGWYKQ